MNDFFAFSSLCVNGIIFLMHSTRAASMASFFDATIPTGELDGSKKKRD